MGSPDDLTGTIVASKWRLESPIGRGTFGDVWVARHVVTGGRKALKLLYEAFSASQEFVDRFVKESQAASRIESPHVVGVDDIGFDEALGRAFLVMECLRGESLYAYLTQAPYAMPVGEATVVLRQLAAALDAAHGAGIVHRDLKPENVFLCWRAQGGVLVKVLDFGIAKLAGPRASILPPVPGAEHNEDAGRTVGFIGTPGYAPPEQIEDAGTVTRAADIFALGVCAFEMLAGASYWKSEGPTQSLFDEVARGIVEPASRRAPSNVTLPVAFDAWFERACAVDPLARFASAGDAVGALEQALGQQDPLPSPRPRGVVDSQHVTDGRWRGANNEGSSGEIVLPRLATPLASAVTLEAPSRSDTGETVLPSTRTVSVPARSSALRRVAGAAAVVLVALGLAAVTLTFRPARTPVHAAAAAPAVAPPPAPPARATAPLAPSVTPPPPAPALTARTSIAPSTRATPPPPRVLPPRRHASSLVHYEPPGL